MSKAKQRLSSVLLTLCLTVALCAGFLVAAPVQVQAAGTLNATYNSGSSWATIEAGLAYNGEDTLAISGDATMFDGVAGDWNRVRSYLSTHPGITTLDLTGMPNLTRLFSSSISPYPGIAVTQLKLPPSVTRLGVTALQSFKLTTFSAPGITEVGARAFQDCVNLQSVSLPNVFTLSTNLFYGCVALRYVYMPAATSIDGFIFFNIPGNIALELGATPPTSVDSDAFKNYSGELTLVVPDAALAAYQALAAGDGLYDALVNWGGVYKFMAASEYHGTGTAPAPRPPPAPMNTPCGITTTGCRCTEALCAWATAAT